MQASTVLALVFLTLGGLVGCFQDPLDAAIDLSLHFALPVLALALLELLLRPHQLTHRSLLLAHALAEDWGADLSALLAALFFFFFGLSEAFEPRGGDAAAAWPALRTPVFERLGRLLTAPLALGPVTLTPWQPGQLFNWHFARRPLDLSALDSGKLNAAGLSFFLFAVACCGALVLFWHRSPGVRLLQSGALACVGMPWPPRLTQGAQVTGAARRPCAQRLAQRSSPTPPPPNTATLPTTQTACTQATLTSCSSALSCSPVQSTRWMRPC